MNFYFEETAIWQRKKNEIFKQINDSGLPLAIFGRTSVVSPHFLKYITVPVQYVCNNNPKSWGNKMWGLEVIQPEMIQEKYDQYNVLILIAKHRADVIRQLDCFSVPPQAIYCMDMHFEEEGTRDFFLENQDSLQDVFCCLNDEESKITFETLIRYRMNRDLELLSTIALPECAQYFPESLGGKEFLSDRESFVDVGAYTGDTVQKFCSAVKGKYKHVYAIEPDAQNFDHLKKNTATLSDITYWQIGISEEEGYASFSGNGTSQSKICAEDTGERIAIKTLDVLFRNTPATFIKMDIEGMEKAALRGAKEIIRQQKPKLAICMYHSNADMIEIPKLILELNPEYKLYVRHYTTALCETVCYAL